MIIQGLVNALVRVVFWLITTLFDMILQPVIDTIFSLFPGVSDYISHINTFLTTSVTYVRTGLRLLLISDTMIITIFDFFVIGYTIYLAMLGVNFGLQIYQKLKP